MKNRDLLLDADNPWPGLESFNEASSAFFHGRSAEIEELCLRIDKAPLTVLFGKSGLGKSSLLRAGLMPELRKRHRLPILVRIDWREAAPPPEQQLKDALTAAIDKENIDAPPITDDESLWGWLHADGLELWDARNFLLTPVFIIDQFEEVFTFGEQKPLCVATWRDDFGNLSENRIPSTLSAVSSEKLRLRGMPYKILIALREDFLPDLEGWRRAVPSLSRNRMRLMSLKSDQAFDAVFRAAPHLMDEALAKRIVQFVAAAQTDVLRHRDKGRTDVRDDASPSFFDDAVEQSTIEPALLCLFCRGLNEKRKLSGQQRFDDRLLDTAKQGILVEYYDSCFEGMPESVSRFVATALITEKGFRNSVSKDDATPTYISEAQLSVLIDRRLVRLEEHYGVMRLELTHDLLTSVVRAHRDRIRREAEAAEKLEAAENRATAARDALEKKMREREDALQKEQLVAARRAKNRFRMLAFCLAAVTFFAAAAAVVAWSRQTAVMSARRDAETQAEAAKRQAETAKREQAEAEKQKEDADRLREKAERRLQRIKDGIEAKQAVLAQDRDKILFYMERLAPRGGRAPRFTATAKATGKKSEGQPLFDFRLMPAPETLDAMKTTTASVTFWMNNESFRNALLTTGPEQNFSTGYTGWGCMNEVVVLVEYLDPERGIALVDFDMCASLEILN